MQSPVALRPSSASVAPTPPRILPTPAPAHASTRPLRIVIVGHVDHGKSTLIGRLFHDTGSLPEGKLEAITASCKARGVPFEWAFLMDAFKAERDQNITIDTAQIWFRSEVRPYVIIDAPGHREFLKNMVTGAASADAAVLVVAADEGVSPQSRRHAYLLSLLGVRKVIVAVNKIDLVDSPKAALEAIATELGALMQTLGLEPQGFLPVSAKDGDNLATPSARTAFAEGPTLLEALDRLEGTVEDQSGPLRFPVQDIYRFDHRRIIAGRIESGRLSVGDTLVFAPNDRVATVKSIEGWAQGPINTAHAGDSVGIVLDDQLFVERGHVATRKQDVKPRVAHRLTARVFWMGKNALEVGSRVKVKCVTQESWATVDAIDFALDANTLETDHAAIAVKRDEVAQVQLILERPLAVDRAEDLASTGRFVLVDGFDVAGGGLVLDTQGQVEDFATLKVSTRIDADERAERLGHRAVTVALPRLDDDAFPQALEFELFARGIHAVIVDTKSAEVPSALVRAGIVALVVGAEGPSPQSPHLAVVADSNAETTRFSLRGEDLDVTSTTVVDLAETLAQILRRNSSASSDIGSAS